MDTNVIEEVNSIIVDIRILEIYRRIVGVEANNCGNAMVFWQCARNQGAGNNPPDYVPVRKENRSVVFENSLRELQPHKYEELSTTQWYQK